MATLLLSARIFKFYLEVLTSLWQALLGIHCSTMVHTARRRFTLLGDGSRCSTTAHNCSVTHHGGRTMSLTARLCSHMLRQAQDGVTQRVQGARGLAVGGTTPDTHGRPHELCPPEVAQPTRQSLLGHGASRKTPGRYPKDTTRSVRIRMIP